MIQAFRPLPGASQRITAGATPVTTIPAPVGVNLARIAALDNPVHVALGSTATDGDLYIPVGGVEYLLTSAGETFALLRAEAADAVVQVSFMSR